MAFGWEGDKVRLVPLDRDKHLENAVSWLNDPEVTQWLEVGDWPITRGSEETYFEAADGDDSEVRFAVESLQGEHIGFCGIHRIDWPSRVGFTGSLIGRRDLWGQGYGTDLARVRARYAFDVLGLRMLISEVMAGNPASVRMLERAGYREAARVPNRYWKRGAHHDQIILVLERPT
jgi:RimJ/RimL family protein N-acetyltransferase